MEGFVFSEERMHGEEGEEVVLGSSLSGVISSSGSFSNDSLDWCTPLHFAVCERKGEGEREREGKQYVSYSHIIVSLPTNLPYTPYKHGGHSKQQCQSNL